MTKSSTKILKIGLWPPGQSPVTVQVPLTPIAHLRVTNEVQNQEFVDRANWAGNSSEHAAVLSISAGWLILIL